MTCLRRDFECRSSLDILLVPLSALLRICWTFSRKCCHLDVFSSYRADRLHRSVFRLVTQVLRYQRGGSPLWVTDKSAPPADTCIPNCDKCGARRSFEFQAKHVFICFNAEVKCSEAIVVIWPTIFLPENNYLQLDVVLYLYVQVVSWKHSMSWNRKLKDLHLNWDV